MNLLFFLLLLLLLSPLASLLLCTWDIMAVGLSERINGSAGVQI